MASEAEHKNGVPMQNVQKFRDGWSTNTGSGAERPVDQEIVTFILDDILPLLEVNAYVAPDYPRNGRSTWYEDGVIYLGFQDVQDLAHELCHYLDAVKRNKAHLRNYGMSIRDLTQKSDRDLAHEQKYVNCMNAAMLVCSGIPFDQVDVFVKMSYEKLHGETLRMGPYTRWDEWIEKGLEMIAEVEPEVARRLRERRDGSMPNTV